MIDDLNKLVKTGLWGFNIPEAARRLIEEGLRRQQWLISPNM